VPIRGALRLAGRYEDALAYYERAFSLAPEEDIAFLYSNVEHTHLALGDTARARAASGIPFGITRDSKPFWTTASPPHSRRV